MPQTREDEIGAVKKTALVTFGCSWTYGVGVCYEPGMSKEDLKENAWNEEYCDKFSFRGILSEKYDFCNLNFSAGGSSNQMQFRKVKELFGIDSINNLFDTYKSIIVLHGLTSTSRNEMYVSHLNKLENFMYTEGSVHAKIMSRHFYDHDYEVKSLDREMNFFDAFYSFAGIKHFWFDTFNTHNYQRVSDHMIGKTNPGRDLLTTMAKMVGLDSPDNQYHRADWAMDTNRIEILEKNGFINPHTKHPTKDGHRMIAEIFDQYIKQVI